MPSNLIGRDAEIESVLEHARRPKHLAIFGAEGVGKTAVLQEAQKQMSDAIYCADTSTMKNACNSLLSSLNLPLTFSSNMQRKRAILRAVCRRRLVVIFDHAQWVAPQLLSLFEHLRPSHTLIIAVRSLTSTETGRLREILWDFDTLELCNLKHKEARQLIKCLIERKRLTVANLPKFEREIARISHGNPRLIIELCEQASRGSYVFSAHNAVRLLDLDRRMKYLRK